MDSLVAEFAFREGADGDCGFGGAADTVNDVPRGGNVKTKAVECLFQISDSQVDFQLRAFCCTGGHVGLPFFVLLLRLLLLDFDAFIIFLIFGGVDGIFETLFGINP